MPSATKTPRTWRTREDPFAEVWATEIEPYLRSLLDTATRFDGAGQTRVRLTLSMVPVSER